ncbi:phosphatidylinositol 5-phosphate 4-kinase type-2 beta-like [Halichondria panicea]|uniref:phosphatidylinositol 5-phosphate 4-kinase type-2 beta-like n=1 Tax=Halichondria panicea TaxID=6063 RepID=UPI00312B4AD0
MPGRGKAKANKSGTKRHYKVKQQKKRFIRSKDPILSVFMWGIQHSINELTTSVEPSLLLPEDFKAFSKIRVENQYYNKENLPGHFKFKEYCPRVFHDLRKRFGYDDVEYMNSLIAQPPLPADSPGRSGAKFFITHDKKLVIKSITTEEVALLHLILQAYHAHLVTTEGQTLLPQYLGTYRLTVNNAETYWIVMRSIFSSTIKMHRKFDLKGSTVDRQASTKEKTKTNPTLKDLDFTEMEENIMVGNSAKDQLMKALEADVQLLQKLNLMDYSLLVCIHDCTIPPDSDDEDFNDCEEDGYISSDDIGEPPQSPHSPGVETSTDPVSPINESFPRTLEPATEEFSSPPMSSGEENQDSLPIEPTAHSPEITTITKSEGAGAVAEAGTFHPIVVQGEKAVEAALVEGNQLVVDKDVDVFAVASEKGTKPLVYYLGIIDVLTNYGARKRAAHAAKTMKHGAGAEISTVRPDQYARRFLEFLTKVIN